MRGFYWGFQFQQLTLFFLLFWQVLKVHVMLLLSKMSTSIIQLPDQCQTSPTSRYRFPVTVASSSHPGDYNYPCPVRANVRPKLINGSIFRIVPWLPESGEGWGNRRRVPATPQVASTQYIIVIGTWKECKSWRDTVQKTFRVPYIVSGITHCCCFTGFVTRPHSDVIQDDHDYSPIMRSFSDLPTSSKVATQRVTHQSLR